MRLLDIGRQMVLEAPTADVFAHIRLSDVARRAGVTTGALYHYWDSQDDYQVELLGQILSPDPYSLREPVAERVRAAAAGGVTLHQLIQAVCADNVDRFFGSSDFRLQVALWVSADDVVRARLAAQYAAVGAEWVEFYRTVFEVYGFTLRKPFTYDWLATALTALLEGLILRAEVDPHSIGVDGSDAAPTSEWGLFSSTVLALLPGVTQEVGAEPVDLWSWAPDRRATGADGD